MSQVHDDEIRQHVRNRYKQIAVQKFTEGSCCTPAGGCCEPSTVNANEVASMHGYTADELAAVPDGANLGLGCGNPQAIAELKPGEVVLDLGSGGGFDCFLASKQVGEAGKVIGVDMTPEMISRARGNAQKGGFTNTDFRLGEIEHLPVADATVDVIISNCVINLSPDKAQVFDEATRVLKSGGRLAISDIVTTATLPEAIRSDMDSLAGCISGASSVEEVRLMLQNSGFIHISVEPKDDSRKFIQEWIPGASIDQYIQSAIIKAVKPS